MHALLVSQVENFGLHVNVDGSVLYGVNVEAIMDRRDDDISLDMLSRMLVRHTSASSGWTCVGLPVSCRAIVIRWLLCVSC
jgi:hypothetical protein